MNYGRLLGDEKKLGGGRVFSLDISVLKKVHTEEYVHQNVLRLYTKLVTPAHVRTLNLSNFGHG